MEEGATEDEERMTREGERERGKREKGSQRESRDDDMQRGNHIHSLTQRAEGIQSQGESVQSFVAGLNWLSLRQCSILSSSKQ